MGKPRSGPAGDAGGVPRAAEAVIGLGANEGDTVATLSAARRALAGLPATCLAAASSLYRTAPIGWADQPDFLNGVCLVRTALAPTALAEALFDLERTLGRVRTGVRNGPRVIDIDLLYYEGVSCDGPTLTLPHPRLHERAFVLYPWVEIMPGFRIPGLGALDDLCRAVQGQRAERLAITW